MSDEQPGEFDHERWLAAMAPQLPYKIEIPPPLVEDDEKPAADDPAWDALCGRPTTVEERRAFYRDREEHGRRIDPANAEVMSEWGHTSDPIWRTRNGRSGAYTSPARLGGCGCISGICRPRRCRCSVVAGPLETARQSGRVLVAGKAMTPPDGPKPIGISAEPSPCPNALSRPPTQRPQSISSP